MAATSSSAPAALSFRVAARTDIGLLRESNEDSILVGDLDAGQLVEIADGAVAWPHQGARGPLLVVCDGMGGVAGGEVASELAIRVTWREMATTPGSADAEVFARLLRRAVRIANAEVHEAGRRDVGLRGMGTTLTAAAVAGARLVVATVGDSRAYVLRGDRLVQVSRDQSLASALAAAGHPLESVETHGAILQALGVAADCEPSLSIIDLRRRDRVLLCSDGLYNLLGEGALGTIMGDPRGPEDATRLLVDAARAAGGSDNISALVMEVDGERLPEAVEGDLPRFREFDPQREGDPALTSTSHVAKRLAARIGLAPDAREMAVPVTGQHMVMPRRNAPQPVPETARPSPARQRLTSHGRGWPWWLAALLVPVAVVVVVAAVLLR
jgi:PPM family protein phosphatase